MLKLTKYQLLVIKGETIIKREFFDKLEEIENIINQYEGYSYELINNELLDIVESGVIDFTCCDSINQLI